MQTHTVSSALFSFNLKLPFSILFFLEETACLAAPANLDQGLIRYKAVLIYVAFHEVPAGPDTYLAIGYIGWGEMAASPCKKNGKRGMGGGSTLAASPLRISHS